MKKYIDLMDFKREIVAIARANNVSWDVGRDMFLANIRNAGNPELPYYKGADHVPWQALQTVVPAQQTREYADMCNAFNRAYRASIED